MQKIKYLTANYIKNVVGSALFEDVAQKDITTDLLVNKNSITSAKIIINEDGVIGGLDFAEEAFKQIDKKTKFKKKFQEGSFVKKNSLIAEIKGLTSSILKSERTAINFLSLISGIATQTKSYVDQVKDYKTKICCTRKTIPLVRIIEKYGVLLGGGVNNRFNLQDEIFIKDNHISALQNIFDLVQNALRLNKTGKVITVEVDNIQQLELIKTLNFNRLLLDNMKPEEIKKALAMIGNKFETEASGNINEKNIIDYAKTGVQRISIGKLTHSPKSLDISLNF
ncbi:MAG: carboxylating nicotinate-nucleotide diphosphorylase [Candidatus Fonsibacter sp.]|jgi:nicotinate-nucleotide pyrophosphorylase (carboxylating)|nr:carboxylating nicotinate-nucleotide diphosphorylase [Pelagibacterales bacterium]